MTIRRTAPLVAALLLAAGTAGAECRPDTAEFRWDGGAARFTVELADTAAERAQGLMFRDHLAQSAGMLFVYERPQAVAFWMRNTEIPLDMIFMAADGRVTAVHAGAVPHDETPIPGPADTLMVLEINGTLAGKLGIRPGAEMRHPAIAAEVALWPCTP